MSNPVRLKDNIDQGKLFFTYIFEWTLHCDMKLCTCTMAYTLHYYLISKLWNN